jgi:hypothetical protein
MAEPQAEVRFAVELRAFLRRVIAADRSGWLATACRRWVT